MFQLLHRILQWTELGTTTKCVTVVILLLSGEGSGRFSVRVIDGGSKLQLLIHRLKLVQDLDMLNRKVLVAEVAGRTQKYHVKCLGFDTAFNWFRDRPSNAIESIAHTLLPFAVQTHIYGRHYLKWRYDTL